MTDLGRYRFFQKSCKLSGAPYYLITLNEKVLLLIINHLACFLINTFPLAIMVKFPLRKMLEHGIIITMILFY